MAKPNKEEHEKLKIWDGALNLVADQVILRPRCHNAAAWMVLHRISTRSYSICCGECGLTVFRLEIEDERIGD